MFLFVEQNEPESDKGNNREIKIHVYCKRQTSESS